MPNTNTDLVKLAINYELDRRRAEIDEDRTLRTITILVAFSERTGRPRRVILRRESIHDVMGF